HDRTIEDGRVHADQAEVFDAACVHHGAVADGDVGADYGRNTAGPGERAFVRHMDDAAVLDVGARTDTDEIDVAAQHAARPDRDVVLERHVADNAGGGIDVDAGTEGRAAVEIGSDVVHRQSVAAP